MSPKEGLPMTQGRPMMAASHRQVKIMHFPNALRKRYIKVHKMQLMDACYALYYIGQCQRTDILYNCTDQAKDALFRMEFLR
mmetsp:Transcript_45930/g.85406  ORF Transcript_45930/g.85406 Transcript_45930/m.85406 type:complete len:82 (-) Transcript_45930:86-331(-)